MIPLCSVNDKHLENTNIVETNYWYFIVTHHIYWEQQWTWQSYKLTDASSRWQQQHTTIRRKKNLHIMSPLEHRTAHNIEMLSQSRQWALWWGGSINVILQQGRRRIPACAVTLHEYTLDKVEIVWPWVSESLGNETAYGVWFIHDQNDYFLNLLEVQ